MFALLLQKTKGESVINMRKNKWIVLLFITGFLILIYPYVSQYIFSQMYHKEVKAFKQDTERLPEQEVHHTLEQAKACNQSIFNKEDGLHDPFTEEYYREQHEACQEAPGDGENIAAIEIPTLDLAIPIYLGATENELSKGVGQVEGSSLPIGGENTHTVLAGHRGMWTKPMFRHLDEVKPGDEFIIYTVEDELEYVVYDTEVILPHETENLGIHEGEDLASLITCHPYGQNSHRLVVHGKRTN